jgi:hypothetical protein
LLLRLQNVHLPDELLDVRIDAFPFGGIDRFNDGRFDLGDHRNPTIVDAQKARQSRADAEFLRDRLRAALPALQLRLQELQAQEYSVQWHDDYTQIEAERDALATELREIYRSVQSKLVDVLTRKKACDAEVSRINGSAPAGVAVRLREVELVARNLGGFTRDRPSITNELKLPDWDQSNKLAWPPPQTPLAVLAVQGMAAAVDHAGDNWWQRRAGRQRSHMEQEGSGSSEARQWSWDRGQPAHAFPMVRGRESASRYCPNSARAVSTRASIGVSPNCERMRFASVRC